MTYRAPTSATTCVGSSPTGALLTHDAERRLTAWQNAPTSPTSQAWMLYDGEGHRVEQYTSGGSGNHTYYLPGNVEEVTPSGSLVKYYSAGGLSLGENTTTTASGISYLASDGLGSVSEALNQTGTATGSLLYGPYGGVRYTSGTMPTAKGFTGQYSDASTGLDYYGARYYDPALGQFTSADTVGGLNRYGYVAGNPETATDPTGHRCSTVDGGVCGGPGSSPPPHNKPPAKERNASRASCASLCDNVLSTFHNRRTQVVLLTLLDSPMGAKFVAFFLSVAHYGTIGDLYITWTKPDQGGAAYTDFWGRIQIDPALLPGDQGTWTQAQLVSAAGALAHEGVESYYALAYGIRSQASQHMDYVAEYYSGEVKTDLVNKYNNGDDTRSAYGLSFTKWMTQYGQSDYGWEPVNQPEVTDSWGQRWSMIPELLGARPYSNAMGLNLDMLTTSSLPGLPNIV